MRRLIAMTGLLGVVAAACGGGSDAELDFTVRSLGGPVQYLQGSDWRAVTDDTAVGVGDEVRTGPGGWAMVQLPAGQSIELAPATSVRLTEAASSDLLSGSVLVDAPRAFGIGLDEVEVRGIGGVFRVDRGFGSRVLVYEGLASLPGSGWDGEVTPLRELVVVGGAVPRAPTPIDDVDPGHRWDQRLFDPWISIGVTLDRLERGLERQLPGKSQRDLIARASPAPIPPGAVRGQLTQRPLDQWAEVVVASVIAAETGTRPGALAVLRQVLDLRDLGASWVVVAAEHGVTDLVLAAIGRFSGTLANLIADAIAPPPAPISGGGGPVPVGPSPPGGTTPPGDTNPPGDGGPPDDPGPPPSPPSQPPPTQPPPPQDGGSDIVEDVVGDIIGGNLAIF